MLKKSLNKLNNLSRHLNAKLTSRRNCVYPLNKPVISFCFDDFPVTSFTNGGQILNKFGCNGTYYVSLGLCNKDSSVGQIAGEAEINAVIEQGHELGCHTFDHVDAWSVDPESFDQSILKNKEIADMRFGNYHFSTFAYPRGSATSATKRIAEKYFSASRGIYQGINNGTIDLNLLSACHIYGTGNDEERLKQLINKTIRERGWLIFYTHDIQSRPSQYGCTPGFFHNIVEYSVLSGAIINPIRHVLNSIEKSHSIHSDEKLKNTFS